MPAGGDDFPGHVSCCSSTSTRPARSPTSRSSGPRTSNRLQPRRGQRDPRARTRPSRCRPSTRTRRRSSRSRSTTTSNRLCADDDRAMLDCGPQQLRTHHASRSRARGLRVHSRALTLEVLSVLAVLGPTASGKSALGLALAERHRRRDHQLRFDRGLSRLRHRHRQGARSTERRGIPHHLIDIADPTEVYTAAQFARDAARAIRDIHARGKLPILVGGTGFYYRALTRGLFPGPGGRRGAAGAARSGRGPTRGPSGCTGCCGASIPTRPSAIMPRDLKRIVRALEVYFTTGRPLTAHFDETRSLIADCEVVADRAAAAARAHGRTRGAARRPAVRARHRRRGEGAARARRAAARRARSAGWSIGR